MQIYVQKEQDMQVEGIIDELGKIFKRRGTHKLLDAKNKKVLYYLKSTKIDLNDYVYDKVQIKGQLLNTKGSTYPVIVVEQITLKR